MRINDLVKNLLITTENAKIKEQKVGIVCMRIIRRMSCSLRGRIIRSTHLYEGDEDDEERWWAACVVIGVVFSVPLLREEFIADHADHPESTNKPQ